MSSTYGIRKSRDILMEEGEIIGEGKADSYRVLSVLDEGGFGQIYVVKEAGSGRSLAMKVEPVRATLPLLRMELFVYNYIKQTSSTRSFKHFLPFMSFGLHKANNFIILELCGPNLMHLRKTHCLDGKMSMGTSLQMGLQMLDAIQDLHSLGWIHRDIKPSNFCIGNHMATNRIIYLIDFGLCRQIWTPDGKHKQPRTDCGFRGTARYASIHIHKGMDLSRRDDLWSLAFVLMEMVTGSLPWRKVSDKNVILRMKEDWLKMLDNSKKSGGGIPPSFRQLRRHCASLRHFTDTPDYGHLRSLMLTDMRSFGIRQTDAFEWEIGGTERTTKDGIVDFGCLAMKDVRSPATLMA